MKKIILIMMAAAITMFAACKKEDKAIISSAIKAPAIITPTTGTSLAVTVADSTNLLKMSWSKADYGVQGIITYFVQIDTTGRNFARKVTLATTTNDTTSMTYGAMNSAILTKLNLAPNVASTIDLRVGAFIGKDTVYSQTIKLTVTTYKELAPAQLYVPGAYQGWNPAAALTIPAVTTYTYEGYIYMATADQFKFTTAPDWNHINYGDGGNGTLTTNGLANGVTVSAPGYYKLNADIKGLTWSATLINSFGVIGTATPQGWNASTAMTYSIATNKWSITLALVPGALKFRANDDWGINYGPNDVNALTGPLIQTNNSITIVNAGNYTVTIDMSQTNKNPYSYTVVKN